MSFANQYIQKYGEKAVEAYKRSLRHSDPPCLESTPENINQQTLKRHPSVSKGHSHHSKSCKSIKHKDKMKPNSSRSLLQPAKPAKQQGLSHAFNSIHLNLVGNPQKKKLIISEMNTPKNRTPNKACLGKGRIQSKATGISTNVNVYVQAVNRSKSKQSTPNRDINFHHISRESREQSTNKNKKQKEGQLMRQIISIIEEEQIKRQSKGLKVVKDKLGQIELISQRKNRKIHKLQGRFQKMRYLVSCTLPEDETILVVDKERQMQQRIKQLEHQLQKYKQKQKSLIRIVETLSGKSGNRWKQPEQEEQPLSNSEQQDQYS